MDWYAESERERRKKDGALTQAQRDEILLFLLARNRGKLKPVDRTNIQFPDPETAQRRLARLLDETAQEADDKRKRPD